jgi:hypothetical protein
MADDILTAVIPATIAGGVAAAGALEVYARFAGEHPVRDAAREWQLRRADLRTLDGRAATATARADLIVTLTTIPSRIDRIGPTIKSLLCQTLPPKDIRVYVPERSRREQAGYIVPAWLAALESIRIVRCDDFGPATKVIPALLTSAPDQGLLVVDDDRLYHPWLVSQMSALADAHRDVAIAASGWDAPANLVDHPTRLFDTILGRAPAPIKCTRVRGRREVDVIQGFSGYVVRPRFFDLGAVADYSHAPEAAFFVDDVWISAQCRVAKAVFGGRRTNCPSRGDARLFKRSSLALVNRGDGSWSSRNNTIMLQYFADRWRQK